MRECDGAQPQSIVFQSSPPLERGFAEFKYSLPSNLAIMSPFVDHLMRLIRKFRIADGTEVDIEVALREALANAVIHGNHKDLHKHVYLTMFCVADGEVSIMIRDEGAGFFRELESECTGLFGDVSKLYAHLIVFTPSNCTLTRKNILVSDEV